MSTNKRGSLSEIDMNRQLRSKRAQKSARWNAETNSNSDRTNVPRDIERNIAVSACDILQRCSVSVRKKKNALIDIQFIK